MSLWGHSEIVWCVSVASSISGAPPSLFGSPSEPLFSEEPLPSEEGESLLSEEVELSLNKSDTNIVVYIFCFG
jgi:hypothetical protein